VTDSSSLGLDLVSTRLQHFAVQPIFCDFFIQVGQLIEEVRTALEWSPHMRYDEANCFYRYGQRLSVWWHDWWSAPPHLKKRQVDHHKYLLRTLQRIVPILDASADGATAARDVAEVESRRRTKPGSLGILGRCVDRSPVYAD
jgi:hypothetical protein